VLGLKPGWDRGSENLFSGVEIDDNVDNCDENLRRNEDNDCTNVSRPNNRIRIKASYRSIPASPRAHGSVDP
jgi:hypothetical protein